jgi:hypothetical protein
VSSPTAPVRPSRIKPKGETMRTPSRKSQARTSAKNQNDGLPRLPNERDESPDSQASTPPRKIMKQALLDLQHGLVDTDLHAKGEIGDTRASAPEPARNKIRKPQPR